MPLPFLFYKSPRVKPPPDLTPVQTAWQFFGVRALMALAVARLPSTQILLGLMQSSYQQELDRYISESEASQATKQSHPSSSTSTASPPQQTVGAMNKAALTEEAQRLGLDVRGATAEQMRVLIRTIRQDQKPKKNVIKGLGSMKKDQLQALARDKGIDNYMNMNADELRLRLQGWNPEEAAATGRVGNPTPQISGSDVVRFGKHNGKTYQEILRHQGQYASWAVKTAEEQAECNPQLKRLAKYLSANRVRATMMEDDLESVQVEIDQPEAQDEEEPHHEDFAFPDAEAYDLSEAEEGQARPRMPAFRKHFG